MDMEIIEGNYKVEWVALGEGIQGEYHEDDPNDVELLRFDVSERVDGEWAEVDAGATGRHQHRRERNGDTHHGR